MEKRKIMISSAILALLHLLLLGNAVNAKSEATETSSEVDRKLQLLNKPAVKSIQSEDGDIIDCVDIYKQPAFDHPALRNHTIKMRPSFTIKDKTNSSTKNQFSSPVPISQTWQKSGSCPDGTIPIRRTRREDLLRSASLEHLGRDGPRNSAAGNETDGRSSQFVYHNGTKYTIYPIQDHSTAFLVTTGYNFIGARGEINVWSPKVESPGEYTTGQIWLKNGPGDSFESVEAGWMVNPTLFGDGEPRLFGRWTLDAYGKTGCINLLCPGFVQTSKNVALGAILRPASQEWGTQYQIDLQIDKDPTGNWWVHFANDEVVGYYPAAILNYLQHSAILVEWGGEVYSKKLRKNSPHTATAMGSGEFAYPNWGTSAYINRIRVIDYSLQLKYPDWVYSFSEEPDCYSANNYQKNLATEPTFFFGGPGRNRYCP